MKRTYSRQEKDLVFDLWKRGAGFSDIAVPCSPVKKTFSGNPEPSGDVWN